MSDVQLILNPPTWDLNVADNFIRFNWIDTEDWFSVDETRKIALCNVAWRILIRKFADYEVPNEAVYLFAAVIASARNDAYKATAQGVTSVDIGDTNISFKETTKTELDELIPREVYDMIGAPYKTRLLWTVL